MVHQHLKKKSIFRSGNDLIDMVCIQRIRYKTYFLRPRGSNELKVVARYDKRVPQYSTKWHGNYSN